MALRYNGILKLGDQIPSFRTVWDTRNLSDGSSGDDQIELPIKGSGYNFNVNWGDGNIDYGIQNAGDARKLHTYATPGIYTVTITGNIVNWGFNGGGDCEKLLRVLEFGPLVFPSNAIQVFWGCKYLDITATDFPDVSNVIDFSSWFRGCENLIWNSNAQSLDTSSGTNFMAMFRECKIFNQDISGLNMSNAEDISHMLNGCWIFNHNIGLWNITNKVTAAHYVLNECREFNYSLNNWDMSNCVTLHYALRQTKLEAGISDWRPTSATRIDHILEENLVFNDDLGEWVLSAVANAERALSGCISFDEPLFNAPNSTLTNMRYMLNLCGNFTDKENRLESLNTSNVELFDRALFGTTKLNPDLSSWNVESGQDFTNFMGEVTNGYSMSMENYDKLLVSWSAQNVNSGITITFSGINYKNSIDERAILVGKGWTINDGGFRDIDESIVFRHEFNEGFYDFSRDNSYYGNHGNINVPEKVSYEESDISGLAIIIGNPDNPFPKPVLRASTNPAFQSLSDSFTLDFYSKIVRSDLDWGRLFRTSDTEKGIEVQIIASESGYGRVEAWLDYSTYGNDYRIRTSSATFLDDVTYNRVTITYDGSEFKLFFNKSLAASVSTATPIDISSTDDWILEEKCFDNFTAYNKALTDQEVSNLTDEV